MLNLDKRFADGFVKVVDTVMDFVPFVDKRTTARMGLDLGLAAAETTLKITQKD